MRTLPILIGFIGSMIPVFSQEWKTIPMEWYQPIPNANSIYTWTHSGDSPQQFKINPYDNSIWTLHKHHVQCIKDGNYQIWNDDTGVPFLTFPRLIKDVVFTSQYAYLYDQVVGMYKYNFLTDQWSTADPVDDGRFLYADQDTVWMSRTNAPFFVREPSNSYFGGGSPRRLVSKNGDMWGAPELGSNGFMVRYDSMGNPTYHYADTIENLLDPRINSLRFQRNSDSLYISGDYGFSIAFNGEFVDTLTPNNTINMPNYPVYEFEFDSEDNIWAYFEDKGIGFYDKSLNEWTQFYDNTNSPLTDLDKLSIEIDTCNNLWVEESTLLHVFTSGGCVPEWLSTDEIAYAQMMIYPNPSSGVFTIETDQQYSNIEIRDLSGRLISRFSKGEQVKVDISGTYLIEIKDQGLVIERKKVIVR